VISLPGIWRAVVGLRFPSGFSKDIKTGGRKKIVNKGQGYCKISSRQVTSQLLIQES
jgi:hypothetical protein